MIDHQTVRPADDRIHLHTRFGDFEADARNILRFPAGLPGFEQSRRFVVLTSPEAAPLQCLHAIGEPPASFLALEPRLVLPDYRAVLGRADRERLQADASALLWLALLSIAPGGEVFANLRAPVAINPSLMIGYQVVPKDSLYPLRHPVALG